MKQYKNRMNQRNQSKEQHMTIQNYELNSEVNVIINGYNIISIIIVHNTFHDDRMNDKGTTEEKNNQCKNTKRYKNRMK